jgi:hypothetical protein
MKELEEKAREMERLHSAIDGGLRRVREVVRCLLFTGV